MKFSLAAAIASTYLLVAWGCVGQPDPVRVYQDAGTKMTGLTAFHATVVVEGTESLKIELDVQRPGRHRYTVISEEGEGSETEAVSVIAIGQRLFIRPLQSREFFGPMPESPFGDIGAFLAALWKGVSDLTNLGQEGLDGTPTHHLNGTVAPGLWVLLEPDFRGADGGSADLWIGVDDSLVHRLRLVRGEETTTFTFSRMNEPIEIEAPTNPRPPAEMLRPGLAQQFGEYVSNLPAEFQDCLRSELGDAAFQELKSGARINTVAERPAFVGCQVSASRSSSADRSGNSVRIIVTSPHISKTLRVGHTVEFEVTAEYALQEGSGTVALVVQVEDGTSLAAQINRKPVSEGTGTVTLRESVIIPDSTEAVHIIVPLYLSDESFTSIVDVRTYKVGGR